MVAFLIRQVSGAIHYIDRLCLIRRMKESENPDLWWKYGIGNPPK